MTILGTPPPGDHDLPPSVTPADGWFTVTTATPEDWRPVEEWADGEGWNTGIGDMACFHATDPGGFFLGRVGSRPVSAMSVVNYSPEYAFAGHYLVDPECRGRGHGLATWNAALPHAGARTVGLDAAPARRSDYRRAGFTPAHDTIRYGGRPERSGRVAPDTVPVTLKHLAHPEHPGHSARVRPPGPTGHAGRTGRPRTARYSEHVENQAHLDAVAAYDRRFFPADRRGFLDRWLTAAGHVAYAALRDGRITGYGVIRPAREGHRVGPLLAGTRRDAEALFDSLTAHLGPDEEVFLDVPVPRGRADLLAAARGLTERSHTVRMYRGPVPTAPAELAFATTTLELG
ncbi:GNAT family N-acetyltransferase [Streptomyces sp. HMX112]|uniref:GNAT family N-acetyltransferase n=1 Tax=Streptomyces sp. HMX112 TaxID=3390850 RepID=UPI003A809C04